MINSNPFFYHLFKHQKEDLKKSKVEKPAKVLKNKEKIFKWKNKGIQTMEIKSKIRKRWNKNTDVV